MQIMWLLIFNLTHKKENKVIKNINKHIYKKGLKTKQIKTLITKKNSRAKTKMIKQKNPNTLDTFHPFYLCNHWIMMKSTAATKITTN